MPAPHNSTAHTHARTQTHMGRHTHTQEHRWGEKSGRSRTQNKSPGEWGSLTKGLDWDTQLTTDEPSEPDTPMQR